MNQGLAFRSIIIVTIAILIFNFENFPNINAFKDSNNKDISNSTDSTTFFLPLPFTSHIADQSLSAKGDLGSIIPFP
jgi:hypothetical protein